MKFIRNDGGRAAAGFTGTAGDCVTRAVAIVSGKPYLEIYNALSELNASFRGRRAKSKRGVRSARDGVVTRSKAFKEYMRGLGFKWTPTMQIGSGCKVHLRADELPGGRLIAVVSRHYTAVIDGVIHDTYNPQRFGFDGLSSMEREDDVGANRCVYGYWSRP